MTDWQNRHGARTEGEGVYAPEKAGWYVWLKDDPQAQEELRVSSPITEHGDAKITLEALEFLLREAGYHRTSGPAKHEPEGL